MTIKDEIARIKKNIANAYVSCLNNGAELPEVQNSDNLSSTIDNISVINISKYGLSINNIFGDVDENGSLKHPVSGTLNAKGIVRVEPYVLANKFCGNKEEYIYMHDSRGEVMIRDEDESEEPPENICGLSKIIFPDLLYIDKYGMQYFCTFSTDLESAYFPRLKEIGENGISYGFYKNENLKSVNFNSLEKLGEFAFYDCFNRTSIKSISFPALKPDSFCDCKNPFMYMLTYVDSCTIHFPLKIKKTIENWEDVISGFGGNKTVILFDLHTATINFTCNVENAVIYIDTDKVENNTALVPAEDTDYVAYDNSSNTALFDTVTGISDNSVKDVSIEFSKEYKTITINTGVKGLEVSFKINGVNFIPKEISDGVYSLNVIGSNKDIRYFVNGGDNYLDEEGTINFVGNDFTKTIKMTSATTNTFTRPNLKANGTLGGDSFAVSTNNNVSDAYETVDDNSSSYWWFYGSDEGILTLYNPKPVKISELNIKYWSDSNTYWANSIKVEGSNNNADWEDLGTFKYVAGQNRKLEINSSRYFKYHRLTLTKYSVFIRISDIGIVGVYKE